MHELEGTEVESREEIKDDDLSSSEKTGKFTVDISEREPVKMETPIVTESRMHSPRPTKDNFVNFLAYHAGMLTFE